MKTYRIKNYKGNLVESLSKFQKKYPGMKICEATEEDKELKIRCNAELDKFDNKTESCKIKVNEDSKNTVTFETEILQNTDNRWYDISHFITGWLMKGSKGKNALKNAEIVVDKENGSPEYDRTWTVSIIVPNNDTMAIEYMKKFAKDANGTILVTMDGEELD